MAVISDYQNIRSALFVKVVVPGYTTLAYTDYHKAYTIGAVTYSNIGDLLAVSNSESGLRTTKSEVTIALSGILAQTITDITGYDIKGSTVTISRGFFDHETGELISAITSNPVTKFKGLVNNFGISENFDAITKQSDFTVSLICTSAVGILDNLTAGRRTNPVDEKAHYPSDLSMDRVPNILNSSFNFGAPLTDIKIGTS